MSKNFLLDIVRLNIKTKEQLRRLSESNNYHFVEVLEKNVDELVSILQDSLEVQIEDSIQIYVSGRIPISVRKWEVLKIHRNFDH